MSSITSIGESVYARLREEMADKLTAIFPVVTDKAELPYACYRRASTTVTPAMNCAPAERANVEIVLYAKTYAQSVELAEAIRDAMDRQRWQGVRRCLMVDASEDYDMAGNAYMQTLTFEIAI